MICLFREFDDQLKTKELTLFGLFFRESHFQAKQVFIMLIKTIIDKLFVFSFSNGFDLIQFIVFIQR